MENRPESAPSDDEFRSAGFTGKARDFPRDELSVIMFAAWLNVTPSDLPEPFKYFPNESVREAWGRVADAAREYLSKN